MEVVGDGVALVLIIGVVVVVVGDGVALVLIIGVVVVVVGGVHGVEHSVLAANSSKRCPYLLVVYWCKPELRSPVLSLNVKWLS